jgi:hypothetical protein
MSPADERVSRRSDWGAVLFALVFPTLLTLVYFILLAGHPSAVQQGAFAGGKFIQFAFPAFWILWIQRAKFHWTSPSRTDLIWGGGLGLVLLAATLALYHLGLKPAGFFAGSVAEAIRQKVEGLGVKTALQYLTMSIFYVIVHSLLEEYYWRWFVFGQLSRACRLPTAIAVSSIAFAAHHVLVRGLYFGWLSPLTWLFTLAIIIGGAFWAWLYRVSDSLAAPWLSHAILDAAIFAIGYQMLAV